MQQMRSIFSKRRLGGFHRRLPDGSLSKAATIMLMGLMVVGCGTFALCVLEPQLDFGRYCLSRSRPTARRGFPPASRRSYALPAGWF